MTGSALAGLLAVTACGDNGSASRLATVDDLPSMVLQAEDVSPGLEPVKEDNREVGFVEPEYDPRAESMLVRQFELASGESGDGAVCILSSALLYASPKDANDTWDDVREIEELFFDEGGGSSLATEELTLPDLGDATIGYRLAEPTEVPCRSYPYQSGDSHHIFFRRWNVAAGLIVYWSGPSHPADDAISLAQVQAGRIEAVFEGDSSD